MAGSFTTVKKERVSDTIRGYEVVVRDGLEALAKKKISTRNPDSHKFSFSYDVMGVTSNSKVLYVIIVHF